MYIMIWLSLAFVTLGIVTNALSSPSVETRPIQEIYQSALKENRTLRVSMGGDVYLCNDSLPTAFQASFPGIKIVVMCDLSKYLDGRINRAYETSNGTDDGADVVIIQTLQNFPRWKAENRLLNYKPLNSSDVYPEFIDEDGAYAGYAILTLGTILYNSAVYQKSDLPQYYTDFLAEKWTNEIILTYPNDDDGVLYLFSLITEKYGWNFIDALKTQNPKFFRGTATPSFYIADNNVTSYAHSISFASNTGFAPGLNSTLHKDVYMAWPQTGAIFASTPAPETAKLFMNFLRNAEFIEMINGLGFGTRKIYDTNQVLKQKNVDPLGFGRFMSDRRLVESWRFQFEDFFGTPQGLDPVEVVPF